MSHRKELTNEELTSLITDLIVVTDWLGSTKTPPFDIAVSLTRLRKHFEYEYAAPRDEYVNAAPPDDFKNAPIPSREPFKTEGDI